MGRVRVARTGLLLALAVLNVWGHLHHHHQHHHHHHPEGAGLDAATTGDDSHAFWCGADDPEDIDALIMDLKQEEWEYKQSLLLLQNNGTMDDETESASHNKFDTSNGLQAAVHGNNGMRLLEKKPHIIPVFFSVLARSETLGRMSNEGLQHTIDVLNRAYRGTNFQFKLQGVQRRMGDEWHDCSLNDQHSWKKTLRVGGSNALNIYICNPNRVTNQGTERLMGQSTWPTNANQVIDGVMVVHRFYYGTLAMNQFLVHEVRKWLRYRNRFRYGLSRRSGFSPNLSTAPGWPLARDAPHVRQRLLQPQLRRRWHDGQRRRRRGGHARSALPDVG